MILSSDGRCGRHQPTGGLTAQVRLLGLRLAARLSLSLHSFLKRTNRVHACNGYDRDNNTINIDNGYYGCPA